MNHSSTHHQNAPVTVSTMISEAVYKLVMGVDRIIHRIVK